MEILPKMTTAYNQLLMRTPIKIPIKTVVNINMSTTKYENLNNEKRIKTSCASCLPSVLPDPSSTLFSAPRRPIWTTSEGSFAIWLLG